MKKVFASLLALALLPALAACGAETEETYLVTSFTQEFNNTTTKTEYVYDKEWNTAEIVTYQNGEEQSRQRFEYTEDGCVIHMTGGGESGTLEVFTVKDAQGNVIASTQYLDGELYSTTETTYDENGNKLSQISDQADNGISVRFDYIYDEHGNQIEQITDYGEYGGGRITTEYDADGNILKSTEYDLNGTLTGWNECSHTGDGTETILHYSVDGTCSGKTVNTYDEAGNLVTAETCDRNGELLFRTTYTYVKANIPVK